MRKRIFIILAVIIAGVVILVAGLFYTPPGRAALAGIIESALGDALGGTVKIGALKGAPPGRLIIENVEVADDGGVWLTAHRAELRWRPAALLNRHISIQSVTLEGAALLRSRVKSATADDARRINTLDGAPHLTIENFMLTDVKLAVKDALVRVDGAGSVRLDGPEIALRLTLTSDGAADQADITLEKSQRRDSLFVDASVNAEPDGVIATLFGLKAPLHLAAAADGSLSEAQIKIGGVAGNFGGVDASLAGDLRSFTGADIKLHLDPGSRLQRLREFAAPLSMDARYETRGDGGALAIRSLVSALGDISGALVWTAPRGAIDRINLDLAATLNPAYRPEIQNLAGATLTLKGALDWRRTDYGLNAVLAGERATITLKNGATDLRRRVAGDARVELAPRDVALLTNGARIDAALKVDFDDLAKFTNLIATTGDSARFAGEGWYRFDDEVIALTGDATAPAALVNRIAPDMTPAGDVTGDVAVEGRIDRFTMTANFETPQLAIGDGAFPPLAVAAALSGLPRLPTGEITAQARDGGPRRFEARLRSSANGAIQAQRLLYEGRGFHLDGSGSFDPRGQTVELDLTYDGAENAEPWPGLTLEGDVSATGVLSRDAALSRMTATAKALRFDKWRGDDLRLTAEGPPGGVSFTLEASAIALQSTPLLSDVSAAGVVDARAAPKITVTKFDATVADLPARLTAPASIDFASGVNIAGLRLAYGANGSLMLDGVFGAERWRADIDVANAPIPDADGLVTLKLALDTDAKTPASGDFQLRTLLLGDNVASISGNLLWDGKTLRVVSKQEGFDLDLHAPLRLLRAPSLSLDNQGALAGRILYDGDVEAVAAYLPPALQTIEGKLDADFKLAGAFAKPLIEGRAALTDGAYLEIESGFALTGLHAEATTKFDGGANLVAFTGGGRGAEQIGADTLSFTGGVRFGAEENLDLDLTLAGAEFAAFPVTRARADGKMTVAGKFNALTARADITIRELRAEIVTPESDTLVPIDIVDVNDTDTDADAAAARSGIDYEVHLAANDRVFISGRGLDSEWRANVTVFDGREAPLIIGDLNLREGALDFAGRRFEMMRGVIRFDRYSENNPTIDMRAEYEADGVTAAINVSGRAKKPEVTLTATGASAEEAMALVMFGKPLRELSVSEAAQSAEALAALTGAGLFGGDTLTGKLKRTVGLDLLNVDLDPQRGGGSVTVGKEVVNGVFVSAKQDIQGEAGSVRVKANVTRNITVETEIEQSGEQTVSANWKKDF